MTEEEGGILVGEEGATSSFELGLGHLGHLLPPKLLQCLVPVQLSAKSGKRERSKKNRHFTKGFQKGVECSRSLGRKLGERGRSGRCCELCAAVHLNGS